MGADPDRIALDFSGATPRLGPDGSLVPTLDGDRVQFALGQYDHSCALVIDPVLTCLTYLGGSGADVMGNSI